MFDRGFERQVTVAGLAASAAASQLIYFPRAARIHAYWATTPAGIALSASATLDVVFNNRGTDGLGNTVLATLTNNSGLTNTATRKLSAYVAKDALELTTSTRPDGSTSQYDLVPAGSMIEVTATKGAGVATGDVYAGMYGFYSN